MHLVVLVPFNILYLASQSVEYFAQLQDIRGALAPSSLDAAQALGNQYPKLRVLRDSASYSETMRLVHTRYFLAQLRE